MNRLVLISSIAALAVSSPAVMARQMTPPAGGTMPQGSSMPGMPNAPMPNAPMPNSAPNAPMPNSTPNAPMQSSSAMGSDMGTSTSNAMPPPPADAMNKTYPMCSATVQDSCMNSGGAHHAMHHGMGHHGHHHRM